MSVTKSQINNKVNGAAGTIRRIRDKYKISVEDASALHKAFALLHTEHVLLETQKTLKETAMMMNKNNISDKAMNHLQWIESHLSIHFREPQAARELIGKL